MCGKRWYGALDIRRAYVEREGRGVRLREITSDIHTKAVRSILEILVSFFYLKIDLGYGIERGHANARVLQRLDPRAE